ncbi:MAG: hypothetical protein ACR2FX_08865 [Chthoniobacterales bacterium]
MRKQAADQARDLSEKVLAAPRASRREQLQAELVLMNLVSNGEAGVDAARMAERLVTLAGGNDDVALDCVHRPRPASPRLLLLNQWKDGRCPVPNLSPHRPARGNRACH